MSDKIRPDEPVSAEREADFDVGPLTADQNPDVADLPDDVYDGDATPPPEEDPA